MICFADGSLNVLNGQHGTETCRKIQELRLAEGKELEDWQEFCYVDILKYEAPWRIRAKVAGLQQAGSQSVTWIPLSEALENMLLYIEDKKREKEPQDFERFKIAVVQAADNSAFLAPEALEDAGHTVCIRVSHGYSARGLAHSMTLFSLAGLTFKNWRDILSLAYYCGHEAVTGMKNLKTKSRKEEVRRNAFNKLEGLHLPSLLQKVCAHMNLKDSTLHTTQNYIDTQITDQWVIFYLDHPDNQQYVNQTAGLRHCRSFSARGLAHSTTVFASVQLPMRRSEQKSQHWARRN